MNIDITTLPSIAIADRLTLRESGAVYFLLDAAGVPLYIGTTSFLKTRLGCHRVVRESPENGAVRVAWFYCDWRLGLVLEADLIFSMQPPLNVRGKRYRMTPQIPPNTGGIWDSPPEVWDEIRTALDMPPPDTAQP